MRVILFPLVFLLLGCKAMHFIHLVDTTAKPLFFANDTIFLSMDYIQHHDFVETKPEEWTDMDDTAQLFQRFSNDFETAARTYFPMNQVSVSYERGCLPWDNLFSNSRMWKLDTLQLQMCFMQKALSAKNSVFVHFIFDRSSNSAGSSRYGSMSASQFAVYIFYVAAVADDGAFYFRSFRNFGSIFNDTKYSVKREQKMINLIMQEFEKLLSTPPSL